MQHGLEIKKSTSIFQLDILCFYFAQCLTRLDLMRQIFQTFGIFEEIKILSIVSHDHVGGIPVPVPE